MHRTQSLGLKLGAVVFSWALLVVGCGGATPPTSTGGTPQPRASASAASTSAPVAAPPRTGRLRRADVVEVLSGGLGAFLARLQIEPVLAQGRFRGWRIVDLRAGDPLWKGGELAPGDIVTSVNGRPLERPEQALSTFQSMAVAPELRVAYERSGARRELVYPIDD